MRLAAIEGGGTTWVCAIAIDNPDNIIEQIEFETKENPYDTLHLIKLWLLTKLPIDAIGIASFGPINCKLNSNTYGYITSTPKVGWYNTNVLYLLGIYDKEFKDIPYIFDTDVNAPALAEFHLQLMKQSTIQSTIEQEQQLSSQQQQQQQASITSCAYITIGTGVGVGLVINNQSVKGLLHPEGGHLQVKRQLHDDSFEGTCPFHKDCIEGLCSSGALIARYNQQRNSRTMNVNIINNSNNNNNITISSNNHNNNNNKDDHDDAVVVVVVDAATIKADNNNTNNSNMSSTDKVDVINESHQEYTIKDLPLIPDDDKIWDTCAYYIAQLCVSLILIASPELICIGGGVMNRSSLYPKIHKYCLELLSGYIQHDFLTEEKIKEYIRPSYWGSKAGIVGAAYLAKIAYNQKNNKTNV